MDYEDYFQKLLFDVEQENYPMPSPDDLEKEKIMTEALLDKEVIYGLKKWMEGKQSS